MKTTLNLDGELLLRAKRVAGERGVTLTSIVEGALRDALDQTPAPVAYALQWKPTKGQGLPPVDPADRDALYDLIEDKPSSP